ncbi:DETOXIFICATION 56 protein [Nymphaea thermarum]|nr:DETOXIFICATION 56 protein [Nymphaea thermarum]
MSLAMKPSSEEAETGRQDPLPASPPPSVRISRWPKDLKKTIYREQRKFLQLALPMSAMNLVCLAKLTISTAFLGRLGRLHLAGGALALTFANVTGFSVLAGLASAMEPICGQAFGAKNFKLLHKTLFMAFVLLLLASIPIAVLWLNVEKILLCFGQDRDISRTAQRYLLYLIPDLVATAFLNPLKAYLSAQWIILPVFLCSVLSVSLHIPINIFLSHYLGGIPAIALSICWTDLNMVVLMLLYIFTRAEGRRDECGEPWWWCLWGQSIHDWVQLLRLCAPCCLMTCLEWWCYEMLVLLTGRLPDAQWAVSVLAIVLNADNLLYSVMMSLATSASTRVANELGANRPQGAYEAAVVAMASSAFLGCLGGSLLVAIRPVWGRVFSSDPGVVEGVKRMMVFVGAMEVVNFPMAVSGGVLRGTAKPTWAVYADIGGFYFLALPVGVVLAFKVGLGLVGLLLGFLIGVGACTFILVLLVLRVDWVGQAGKAQDLACVAQKDGVSDSTA